MAKMAWTAWNCAGAVSESVRVELVEEGMDMLPTVAELSLARRFNIDVDTNVAKLLSRLDAIY